MAENFASAAEFMIWAEQQGGQHEFIEGQVSARKHDTVRRSIIRGNLVAALRPARIAHECRICDRGLRLATLSGDVLYPDVIGVCGHLDEHARQIGDAMLVIDIAEAETDRAAVERRIRAYQSLPSLRHIAVVFEDERTVSLVTRPSYGPWSRVAIDGDRALVPFAAVGMTLGISDIFADTEE